MSREILFRGKRKDNGEWVEGYLIPQDWNTKYFIGNIRGMDLDEIIPKTRGQYTGLKDKNGRKIFEGDILRGKGKNVYEVVYPENIAGFVTRGTGVLSVPCMNYGTMKYYEIVGNIYDNPELLEVK